jgi:hypothetical protein
VMYHACRTRRALFRMDLAAITLNRKELGNLQLTADEEQALVAFMKTLSDGFASAQR